MTVCVAALCDNRKTLILAADKMVGVGYIESDLDIEKALRIHRDWWVMIAGNDVSPAFDIIDNIKNRVKKKNGVSVSSLTRIATEEYLAKKKAVFETANLDPLGWNMKRFNSEESRQILPAQLRVELYTKMAQHQLDINLLFAGFDRGQGHVFHLGKSTRGVAKRHDIPGFYVIGSGTIGGGYMMYYRDYSFKMPSRLALYYATEAKYFGELAGGVGTNSDIIVARAGGRVIRLSEESVDDIIIKKLCERLSPRSVKENHVEALNSIPELKSLPRLKVRKVKGGLAISDVKRRRSSPKSTSPKSE
jgi:hypothetical protein